MVFFQRLLEQRTGVFLYLIDQEGQHRQESEDGRQILDAMAEVVFEMVALVFEGVEGFVLNLPAASSSSHDGIDGVGIQGQIGDPGEVLGFLGRDLLVVQKVDADLLVAIVEGQIVDLAEAMGDALIVGIDLFEGMALPLGKGGLGVFEQRIVAAFFDPQDKAHIYPLERFDMGGIGRQRILDDDQG